MKNAINNRPVELNLNLFKPKFKIGDKVIIKFKETAYHNEIGVIIKINGNDSNILGGRSYLVKLKDDEQYFNEAILYKISDNECNEEDL